MKLLIASDIHGSIFHARRLERAFLKHQPDQIILLGDLLYIGPRNKMHIFYHPKKVMDLLNKWARKIKAVRGNCDAEIDLDVMHFSMPNELSLKVNNYELHFVHGDKLDLENIKLKPQDLLFFGHTHIPLMTKKDDFFLFNPGSITYPKDKSPHTYMIFNFERVELYNLNHKLLGSYNLR